MKIASFRSTLAENLTRKKKIPLTKTLHVKNADIHHRGMHKIEISYADNTPQHNNTIPFFYIVYIPTYLTLIIPGNFLQRYFGEMYIFSL